MSSGKELAGMTLRQAQELADVAVAQGWTLSGIMYFDVSETRWLPGYTVTVKKFIRRPDVFQFVSLSQYDPTMWQKMLAPLN